VLQRYAIERLLYRVSKSKHAKSVILKGALLLKTIGIPSARPTLDIDMPRQGKAGKATLVALTKDCAALDVDADGLKVICRQAPLDDHSKPLPAPAQSRCHRQRRRSAPPSCPVDAPGAELLRHR
jgi:hypothetical protein